MRKSLAGPCADDRASGFRYDVLAHLKMNEKENDRGIVMKGNVLEERPSHTREEICPLSWQLISPPPNS